ncbi:hypothetical protein [Nocardioides houyundeii]|uniref:hypothetical protein n=1 Tax=Nocardioides houyundeii TaxID=2045452 RepID=UPI0013151CB3|nr:hypothetical protein [Nocardioides houyundeii]
MASCDLDAAYGASVQSVLVALVGALGAVVLSLFEGVGTRGAALRHLKEESELIAALPDDDPRRAVLQEASLFAAERYRDHAKTPRVKRNRWVGLISSSGLLAMVLYAMGSVSTNNNWENVLFVGAGLFGLYAFLRFATRLMSS